VFEKTPLQEALSNTGGITTSSEFPEQANVAEEEVKRHWES
jgi:hypothetical protein